MDDCPEGVTQGPKLVPASLQRVRCFLQTRGRMKVRPWASAEDVLDALHASLEGRRGDDEFWDELSLLLDALCRDAVTRSLGRHAILDNELLEPARIEALVNEIRASLHEARSARAPFRQLAGRLSGPGAALLLLLGGATTVGCYRSHGLDADAAVVDAGLMDATRPDTSLVDAARRDTGRPDTGRVDAGPVCDAVAEVAECTLPADLSAELCACIEGMNESWQTALRQLVDRTSCEFLANQAYCLLNTCADPSTPDFDLEMFLDGCSVALYLGVRFD